MIYIKEINKTVNEVYLVDNAAAESKYGKCVKCGGFLRPVWFIEKEYYRGYPTGRKRRAVSHLECEDCLRNVNVDDTFDGDWYR